MNKKIYIFLFVLVWFILNIFLYLISSNYRYFLQSLKYEDFKEYNVSDEFKISIKDLELNNEENLEKTNKDNIFAWLSSNFWDEVKEIDVKLKDKDDINGIKDFDKNKIDNKEDLKWNEKVEYLSSREEIKLTNIEKTILEKFEKYDLKEVDLHPRLFDLTWEYPDKYYEYYGKDINLYFFWNKLYSDLVDIFEVLTYELPFSINEVNNFWTKSFYINLNDWFDDWYVRVVIEKSNRLFWIKVKKELYSEMKDKLAQIFSK